MILDIKDKDAMINFGNQIGSRLKGGEIIELVGDIGSGKTTLVKGIAKGLKINEDIQSPSFTISRVYDARDKMLLVHYDFYRLNDPGILINEIKEFIDNKDTIIVLEWSDSVKEILPENRLIIQFENVTDTSRRLTINSTYEYLV